MRPLVAGLAAALIGLAGCSPYNVDREKVTPSAPTLDTLFLTSFRDTLACIRVIFADTNTIPVSYTIFRTGPNGGEFFPLVTDVPGDKRAYSDWPVPNTFLNDYDRYAYRMVAVSDRDSVSVPSNSKTIRLINTPPVIDSIGLGQGYPVIYYTIDGRGWGVDYTLEIVNNDSVMASFSDGNVLNLLTTAHAFPDVVLDSLKARAQRDPSDDRAYGVRLLAVVSADSAEAFGIDVAVFRWPLP